MIFVHPSGGASCPMQNDQGRFIEISQRDGYSQPMPSRVYSEALPEVLLNENPIELQEVCYTASGQGVHRGYSYRPDTSLLFHSDAPPVARLHKHEYFELLFLLSAHIEVQIESRFCQLRRGDVCILNCSTRHAEHFEPDLSLCYLLFAPGYLRSFPEGEGLCLPAELHRFFVKGLRDPFLQNRDYLTFRWLGGRGPLPLLLILNDLRDALAQKRPGYQLFVRGHLLRMFALLADPSLYRPEYIDLGADGGFSLAHSAKQLIDKTPGRISRQELAGRLNYSAAQIDRTFRRHYGCTVSAYSRQACLRRAAGLLRQTSLCVHEICRQLGLVDRTSFYRQFERAYGCTPAQYRAEHRL